MATKTVEQQIRELIPQATDVEALRELNRLLIAHMNLLGTEALNEAKAGDVIFTKWNDGYTYPLVVNKVNRKRLSCYWIYEDGSIEGWTVPGTMVSHIVTGRNAEDIVKAAHAYAEEHGHEAPYNDEEMVKRIEAARSGRAF